MKARGFVERSGMVICGALLASEMPLLTSAIPLSRQEQQKLISWPDPPAWDSRGVDIEPPGRGKFLIKVGGRPGIPVLVGLSGGHGLIQCVGFVQLTDDAAGIRCVGGLQRLQGAVL